MDYAEVRPPAAQGSPGLAEDLDALAAVIAVAAEKDVACSLVLRLHATESMQMVMSRESRQGSFW